jgi:hypothetical protein
MLNFDCVRLSSSLVQPRQRFFFSLLLMTDDLMMRFLQKNEGECDDDALLVTD